MLSRGVAAPRAVLLVRTAQTAVAKGLPERAEPEGALAADDLEQESGEARGHCLRGYAG